MMIEVQGRRMTSHSRLESARAPPGLPEKQSLAALPGALGSSQCSGKEGTPASGFRTV
jgi:hypothetical protein